METERDFVVFTDDDGNEFELDVIRYFEYEENEYAILIDCSENCNCEEGDGDCECETSLYIMRVIVNEEENTEEFVPPEDKDMEALVEIAESLLSEDCDCSEEDCDCSEEDCACCEGACNCEKE